MKRFWLSKSITLILTKALYLEKSSLYFLVFTYFRCILIKLNKLNGIVLRQITTVGVEPSRHQSIIVEVNRNKLNDLSHCPMHLI